MWLSLAVVVVIACAVVGGVIAIFAVVIVNVCAVVVAVVVPFAVAVVNGPVMKHNKIVSKRFTIENAFPSDKQSVLLPF